MPRFKIRELTEIGTSAALALILSFIKVYRMPQGGSITLETIPILLLALLRGPKVGMATGFTFGIIKLLINPYIIHPVQLLLDYPLPFAILGIAGLLSGRSVGKMILGICLGSLARGLSHFLSGAIFFSSFTPKGINVWLYSALYNGSYIIPEMIICSFLVPPLVLRLKKS